MCNLPFAGFGPGNARGGNHGSILDHDKRVSRVTSLRPSSLKWSPNCADDAPVQGEDGQKDLESPKPPSIIARASLFAAASDDLLHQVC